MAPAVVHALTVSGIRGIGWVRTRLGVSRPANSERSQKKYRFSQERGVLLIHSFNFYNLRTWRRAECLMEDGANRRLKWGIHRKGSGKEGKMVRSFAYTRDLAHKGILERFETLLNDYFLTDQPSTNGLPSVAWCARELNLSANYFGDLIRKETGRSAKEYIQSKDIDIAKGKIFDATRSISEIAYDMGFKYPQHFTRLFKQMVGDTPKEYRALN